MSWLSVGLRDVGLGGVVDALDGVEDKVKTAVATSTPVVQLEDQSISSVGAAAQKLVVDKITAINPTAGEVAAEVTTPLFAGLEAYLEHFLQNVEPKA